MALALVHSQGSTAAASLTPAYTVTATGTASGTGLVIVVLFAGGAQTISSITDDKSNTWTQAIANTTSITLRGSIWYVDPATYVSGVTTVTVHFSGGTPTTQWFFYEVSGMASAPFDKTGSNEAGNSSAPTATTATLAQANEFAAAGIGWNDVTHTISGLSAGWSAETLQSGNSGRLQAAHQITAATTALTYAGTINANANAWVDVIATFKEAAAVTSAPLPIRVMSQAVSTAAVY